MIKLYLTYSDDCQDLAEEYKQYFQERKIEVYEGNSKDVYSCAVVVALISDNTAQSVQDDINVAIVKHKPIRYVKVTDADIDVGLDVVLSHGKEASGKEEIAEQVQGALKKGMGKTVPIFLGIAIIVVVIIVEIINIFKA